MQTEKRLKNVNVRRTAKPVLLGITKASLETESFLSPKIIPRNNSCTYRCKIKGKRDDLLGLKENVIIGKLIPPVLV